MARRVFVPNAPSRGLWIAAFIVGVLGILAHFIAMGDLSRYSYWLLLAGFVMLLIGTSSRNL